QSALMQHQDAIDAALGPAAAEFWRDAGHAAQAIDDAADKASRSQAIDQFEAICRRHPAVWQLVASAATPPPPKEDIPMPTPEKPAAEKNTLETWLTALREGITGCLGVLIVLTTLALVLATFLLMLLRPTANFETFQTILVMLNGMTGAVLGYYFGRIPAEAQASKADKARATAQRQVADVHAGLQELDAELSRAATATTRGAKGAGAPDLDAARARVQRLLAETAK
ncbi:MAG: hypothetical protein KJ734_07945, partial [Chloroflexi bacterium]|nr:hypothetical protein [Chloroflexota bacterium]